MLGKLQLLLIEQKNVLRLENPMRGTRIAAGLHQLQSAIFGLQILIIGLLMLVLLVSKNTTRAVEVSGWFLVIGISLVVFMAVFSERAYREEPSFPALMRFCILMAVSSAIPIMLAALAVLFEGLTLSVIGLFASSLIAFMVCWTRLEVLAMLVPQILEDESHARL